MKARLVVKGFIKHPYIAYQETISPIIQPTIIRLIMSLTTTNGWTLHQIDIKNAFLHSIPAEEVFMSQPPALLINSFLLMFVC